MNIGDEWLWRSGAAVKTKYEVIPVNTDITNKLYGGLL